MYGDVFLVVVCDLVTILIHEKMRWLIEIFLKY